MIRMCLVAFGCLALGLGSGWAQERTQAPKPPKGDNPYAVVIAEPRGKDGSTVRLWVPVPETGEKDIVVEGKKQKVTFVVYKLVPVDVTVDGKEVRAFDTAGKPLSAQALAKRLTKRTPAVMCFTGHGAGKEKDLDPKEFLDPYYLQVLNPETVVFLGGAKLLPGAPGGPPMKVKD